MQAVRIAQVNATVPTSAAPSAGKFNNIDSQIGTQVADGSSKQILSQTVVQKTIPSVPATMMYPGIAMTMPGRTMTKPGMTMLLPRCFVPSWALLRYPLPRMKWSFF